ncbi:hypothetical protein [Caballeronia ptereochthonis]|uniref:Uncharacterized protein n=1 Tax=Caballeronia ptereochthonis TaxID=1777144 RepID=A0A158DME8_9BURK|nr:hypothetical protein [Caballeronia ptereochthonis]SAK95610.1 hypothetical protein AWB83_05623 [Caballeronia ptereochthonis]
MSKREQANEEFLEKLRSRTSRAIQRYFFSHGVCVSRPDVRKAMRLPEHEQLFVALAPSFAQINEAIGLLTDIGSLSLPSKEKTMRAVYEIEARLQEREGAVEGMETALARIGVALRSAPRKPKLWPYAFWGTILVFMAYVAWPWALAGAIVYIAALGKHLNYRKRKAEADRSFNEANEMFEAVAELELTPRLKLLEQ